MCQINFFKIKEKYIQKHIPASVRHRISVRSKPCRKQRKYTKAEKQPEKLVIFVASDKGTKQTNEDAFCIYSISDHLISAQSAHEEYRLEINNIQERGCLIAVADGISSLNYSQKTAKKAVELTIKYYPIASLENGRYMNRIAKNINNDINKESMNLYQMEGRLGTTLTMAYIEGNQICFSNIGDSPAYLISRRKVTKVTVNDTLAEELINHGLHSNQIDESAFHTLTQYAGQANPVKPHVVRKDIKPGDIVMLLTDGIADPLDLFHTQNTNDNPAETLIKNSFDQSADDYMDNSTVIIIYIR